MLMLGLLVELFKCDLISGLPFCKSVSAASMQSCGCSARAGEFSVPGEDQKAILLNKDAVSNELRKAFTSALPILGG